MKNFNFIFILISALFFGQNQRFIYEYTFKPDSLNRQNVVKEIMNLDITKEGSNFYTHLLLTNDSLFNAEFEKGKAKQSFSFDMRKMKKSNVNFRISKKYPDFETIYYTSINADKYAIKELKPIHWTILSETKIIEDYKVQKAIAVFGEKKWTAWFSLDIPIQEGPYMFCGLPGLILQVEDEKCDHAFKFIGNQKLDNEPTFSELRTQQIFITQEKFNSLWNEYKKDPAKNIKQIHDNSELSDTIFSDSNGNQLTKQDLIRNKEEGAKKYFEHYNNFIYLSLYK